MMVYADLHIHTNHSDGTMEIEDVFQLAKSKGIHALAITDHDTVHHWKQIQEIAQKMNIEVIRGVEMSCYDEEVFKKVHIVGLWLHDQVPHVEKLCNRTLQCRDRYHRHMIEELYQKGYDITYEDAQVFSPYNIVFKMHIFMALMKKYPHEMNPSRYRELFVGKTSREIDRQMGYIPVDKGIQAIHQDGGIAILAHPCEYDNYDEVDKYVRYGLDGVEISHPSMKETDYPRTWQLTSLYSLIASGGSDFHDLKMTSMGEYGLTQEQFEKIKAYAYGVKK